MSDTTQSSSAGAASGPVDTAAASPQAPAPHAAANYSKQEQKPCERCGKLFGRAIYKKGDVQSHSGFTRRRFCSIRCASKGNTNRRARA